MRPWLWRSSNRHRSGSSANVTESGGTVRDGEQFSLFAAGGGLTGVTAVTINGIACTSVNVTDDENMTAVAPADDLLHGQAYTMAFTGGTISSINNVYWNPPTGWDWVAYDGGSIPATSVLFGKTVATGDQVVYEKATNT